VAGRSDGVPTVGVLANPLSGRDVRRLEGRADTQTHELKRGLIRRAVVGAAAAGAQRIVVMRDVFRIAEHAVEFLDVGAEIVFCHGERRPPKPRDTLEAAAAMREEGCGAVVVFGGDGTNRLFASAWRDVPLVPVSTGTNNVFPKHLEATVAGAAAGLVAAGVVPLEEAATRAKVVEFELPDGRTDIAVVDAVVLEGDHPGSLRHLDPGMLRDVVLARSEPASVGISPIGGLVQPATELDDWGVALRCTPRDDGGRPLLVPTSPGVYEYAHLGEARRLALGEWTEMHGPGVLACDGDRLYVLKAGEAARARVVREGPWVIDERHTLLRAAEQGIYLERTTWRDGMYEEHDHEHYPGSGCC
jgi:hypothetical protein